MSAPITESHRELANIRSLANRRNKQDHSQDTTHQLVASLDQALDIAQAELAAEREKVQALRDALQSLHDEQNGPPLRRRRDHWQMAMNNASSALAATENTP